MTLLLITEEVHVWASEQTINTYVCITLNSVEKCMLLSVDWPVAYKNLETKEKASG